MLSYMAAMILLLQDLRLDCTQTSVSKFLVPTLTISYLVFPLSPLRFVHHLSDIHTVKYEDCICLPSPPGRLHCLHAHCSAHDPRPQCAHGCERDDWLGC